VPGGQPNLAVSTSWRSASIHSIDRPSSPLAGALQPLPTAWTPIGRSALRLAAKAAARAGLTSARDRL
jgi:hypothetical protein